MKKSKIPRHLNESGRPEDGSFVEANDIFFTNIGRITTPYPSKKHIKFSNLWLIENAILEAESRKDNMNLCIFKGERLLKTGELPAASIECMLMYLFAK